MDAKLLTESGWKAVAQKSKVKDNGLQRALATYEGLDGKACDEGLKAIASVSQLAAALKKVREVAALPDVVKYLTELVSVAESQKAEIAKAKAAAEKAQAQAQKKAAPDAKAKEKEDEAEEEQGEYHDKLVKAFQKLKSTKDVAYQFIVCDAKPYPAVMVAKKITSKHKEELTNVTGGSRRFLHLGTCQFQDGRFVFTMEQPVSGLARKLQESIKNFTGKKLPIRVGTESAEEDEAAAGASSAQAASPAQAALESAPEVWHGTRRILDSKIGELKKAIRNVYAGERPELLAAIDETLAKVDVILDRLDHRLAESLAKAHAAKEPPARQAELKNAKVILTDYIKYVGSEPLIAHLDANPLGMDLHLKQVLSDSLKHMAQVIG